MAPLSEQGRQVVRQLRLLAVCVHQLDRLADELEYGGRGGAAALHYACPAIKAAVAGIEMACALAYEQANVDRVVRELLAISAIEIKRRNGLTAVAS